MRKGKARARAGLAVALFCGCARALAGEGVAEQGAQGLARAGWASPSEAASLRLALSQREAEMARAEEVSHAKEKTLFAAFALSALSLGAGSEEAFWRLAPAPAPLLKGSSAGAFSDGSWMRFEPPKEAAPGVVALRFEGLGANACRALAERALEQALDASGASDPFRRHALMEIEFGRQSLESLSFRRARQAMAAPEGLAAQWRSARPGPAASAALEALSKRQWDPCAQMLPSEALVLRFRDKGRR